MDRLTSWGRAPRVLITKRNEQNKCEANKVTTVNCLLIPLQRQRTNWKADRAEVILKRYIRCESAVLEQQHQEQEQEQPCPSR